LLPLGSLSFGVWELQRQRGGEEVIQKRRLKLVEYPLGSLRLGVWKLQRERGRQKVSLQALQIQDLPCQGNPTHRTS
jgi:hypothetical protein